MAASRKPGPIGTDPDGRSLDDGTMTLKMSPLPGSIGTTSLLPYRLRSIDGPDLTDLLFAVKSTKVALDFLGKILTEPKLKWGNTGAFHAQYDGESTITLNKSERETLRFGEWMQVLTMELGNMSNQSLFALVRKNADDGSLSKDEFVLAMERIEFDVRDAVVNAYQQGEFDRPDDTCKLIFPGGKVSFDKYFTSSIQHRKEYEDEWTEYCRKKYLKLHPNAKD